MSVLGRKLLFLLDDTFVERGLCPIFVPDEKFATHLQQLKTNIFGIDNWNIFHPDFYSDTGIGKIERALDILSKTQVGRILLRQVPVSTGFGIQKMPQSDIDGVMRPDGRYIDVSMQLLEGSDKDVVRILAHELTHVVHVCYQSELLNDSMSSRQNRFFLQMLDEMGARFVERQVVAELEHKQLNHAGLLNSILHEVVELKYPQEYMQYMSGPDFSAFTHPYADEKYQRLFRWYCKCYQLNRKKVTAQLDGIYQRVKESAVQSYRTR